MMKSDLPNEAQCKRASSLFNDVLEPAFHYADRKRLTARTFASYREASELWEGFPEEWEESALGMLAAGAVFTRPDRVAAFLRSTKGTLRSELVSMVRLWRERPWAWTFFTVAEEYGNRRLRITPVGTPPSTWSNSEQWDDMLIYSRAVTNTYQAGANLFFTQLADVGPAFVTHGSVIPFRGLEEADVLFLADVVRHAGSRPGSVPLLGVADETTPVSDVVAADPIPFLALLRLSDTPPVRTPHGAPGRFASCVSLPDSPAVWSESAWREAAVAAGETVSGARFDDDGGGIGYGEGSPMYDPAIYLSRESERAFLEAYTREGYNRGRAAASRVVEFPESPEVNVGILAVTAASRILGLDDTLLDECGVLRRRYEDATIGGAPEEEGPSGEDEALPASQEEFQAIADRLLRNHNEGLHEGPETIAAELGVATEVVENVRRQLEGMLSRMDAAGEGHLAADRFGLSPRAFAELTRGGIPTTAGVIRLRETDEIRNAERLMAQATYLRGVRWLLDRALSTEGLPATRAGYIAPAVVTQAHEARLVPSITDFDDEPADDARAASRAAFFDRFRPKKESDWLALLRLRNLAESAHLLRLSGRRFQPTETAQRLMDDPVALYRHLLVTGFRTFEWAEGARFDPTPELHRMAGFLFYAAGELCDARDGGAAGDSEGTSPWVPMSMLADRFIAAVPYLAEAVREEESSEREGRREVFGTRGWARVDVDVFFVDHLGVQFGLLERNDEMGDSAAYRTTPLYDAVFERSEK